jgi:hypothetical protein
MLCAVGHRRRVGSDVRVLDGGRRGLRFRVTGRAQEDTANGGNE